MSCDWEKFQSQFCLDYSQLVESNSLMKLMKSKPEQVKFHLECIKSTLTYDPDRLLPHPCVYIQDISNAYLKSIFSNVNDLFKLLEVAAKLPDATDQIYFELCPTLMKLLYFIIFTCPLRLERCSSVAGEVFIVKCSDEKENQFAQRKGEMNNYVSYRYHATNSESVFSICRNGIKALDGTKFCRYSATFGKGIYMSKYNNGSYAPLVLMYAAKNAESVKRRERKDEYVFRNEEDVILRAILWKPRERISRDKLIELIHKAQFC